MANKTDKLTSLYNRLATLLADIYEGSKDTEHPDFFFRVAPNDDVQTWRIYMATIGMSVPYQQDRASQSDVEKLKGQLNRVGEDTFLYYHWRSRNDHGVRSGQSSKHFMNSVKSYSTDINELVETYPGVEQLRLIAEAGPKNCLCWFCGTYTSPPFAVVGDHVYCSLYCRYRDEGHKWRCAEMADDDAYKRLFYIRRFPKYCTHCDGTGMLTYEDDPSPAGVGLSPGTMTFEDPCPECVEKGICPRCGNMAWPDDDVEWPQPCKFCNWEEGVPGVPPEERCRCGAF